jgi:hypothetical protein
LTDRQVLERVVMPVGVFNVRIALSSPDGDVQFITGRSQLASESASKRAGSGAEQARMIM